MSGSSKKLWWIIILIIAVVLVLFFFFRGKNSDTGKVASKIIQNNTLRVSVGGEPASLDPNLITGNWESKVDFNLFEGLTVRNKDGSIIPGVATKWSASKDGKTYTFYLRKNAKWSDGKPVTAADFEYSMKRLLNPKTASAYASLLYVIKGGEAFNSGKGSEQNVGVKALDSYTLRVELVSPSPFFPELVSHTTFMPIPKHVVVKKGKAWSNSENMVNNGAYKLVAWKPRAYIEAVKNPYYWDKDNVKINKVYFYTQDDNAALLKRYRANEIDVIPDLSVESYSWAVNNVKNQVKVFPYIATYYYEINLKDPKFKNPKVRLALNMAIDRDFITQKVLKAPEVPVTYSLIPPGIKGYTSSKPEWASWSMDKRITEAKKLLKEAGYSEKKPLSFSIAYNTLETNKQVAVAIAAMWQRVGVKAQPFNKEVAVHFADLVAGKFEVGRSGWIGDYADPSSFIGLFLSKSGNNHARFESSTYDKEFWAAMNSNNSKKEMQHYHNAEQMLLNANAIIPLYNYVARAVVKPWVKGYEANNMDIHLIKFMSLSN